MTNPNSTQPFIYCQIVCLEVWKGAEVDAKQILHLLMIVENLKHAVNLLSTCLHSPNALVQGRLVERLTDGIRELYVSTDSFIVFISYIDL